MTREKFETYRTATGNIFTYTEEQEIEKLINLTIQTFYQPDFTALQFVKRKGLFLNDVINWGDLSCIKVIRHGNGWMATIEEAGEAAELKKFMETLLSAWGWDVEIRTQW